LKDKKVRKSGHPLPDKDIIRLFWRNFGFREFYAKQLFFKAACANLLLSCSSFNENKYDVIKNALFVSNVADKFCLFLINF
jgi:hypothetical protein